jgi:16S rRNA (guanine966-N2)-methyltransferase
MPSSSCSRSDVARGGRLRVIAGSAGGRRLESPVGADTRPTAERVREAVFASLADAVDDASVLDLYAGSGAMAIEALSRGAQQALLVESDAKAAAVCGRNLETIGASERGRVVQQAVERVLSGSPPAEAPFDLVCCDPPYSMSDTDLGEVLALLAAPGWLACEAVVVVERAVRSPVETIPNGWRLRLARSYGDTLVTLLSAGDPDPAD